MWSLCFIGLLSGFFWLWITLKNLGDPFHQHYPENTAIEAVFCVFGFLVAALGYCWKITVTRTAITYRSLPFITRVYPIESIQTLESKTKGNAVIRLFDGRKIAVGPFYSGRPYFLENLRTLIGQVSV